MEASQASAPTTRSVSAFDTRLRQILAGERRGAHTRTLQYSQLWDSLERMALGGKMLRPRLLIDAHEALDGRLPEAAADAACAMQLLHIGLVIHDDVIDDDIMRRGEMNIAGQFSSEATLRGATGPAARTWGLASSLLAGDLMLTRAQSLLARLDVDTESRLQILDVYDATIADSAVGEQSDVWLSLHLEPVGADEVLAMTASKTSAYSFEAPLAIAAVIAGAGPDVAESLQAIGRQVGIVYQLTDDVLGLFGDEPSTGKSTLSDLREGKETLLINAARAHPGWADVAHLFGDRRLDAADAQRLRQVIEDSGARLLVESAIAEHCETITNLIAEAQLPELLAHRLEKLTSTCRDRCS